MRRSRPGAVLAFVAAATALAPADERVAAKLAALVERSPARATSAIIVVDLDDRRTLFEHNPDLPLKPASVLKLFTTAAALHRFGPRFAFETRVFLAGDELWIVGGGDPGLGDERIERRRGLPRFGALDAWAERLRSAGVASLSRIVLDDGVFDRQPRHPDWPDSQSQAWYQAPVGGLNLNDNCLDARLRLRDGRVLVELAPPLPDEFLHNLLRVGQRHEPRLTRDADVFELTGTIARDADLPPTAVGRPEVFFGHAVQALLARRGIRVDGPVVRRSLEELHAASLAPPGPGQAGAGAPTLLCVERTTLPEVLWRANAFSQNLFAECLLKALEAYEPDGRRSGRPGSWEGGQRVLRSVIEALGVDLSGAVLRDGSGLSHANRLTARQVVNLLSAMHRHPHADAFAAGLAQAGEEGTMRRRYAEPALVGRLRGKTGTIANVQTLAGYLARPDGHVLALAVLVNGSSESDLHARVCTALLQP